MLTRINQADFKCVMTAMDLDHQLSDTSRAAKEAEPEVWAELRSDPGPERRSSETRDLSLECDDRSPRSSRGAERNLVERGFDLPGGYGAVAQGVELSRGAGVRARVFTQVDKLSGVTWSPSPASDVKFEVFAQVEKPSGVLQT
ncbi:hypothetical protein PHYSODRAFT_341532 [Phytophthora sojae]|uniref:Uncharacterized protein n=1 Tax=Phytophthora sojae (strain P6497) TaxID=1094619 RepID=G5ADJ6_PHYSP|nr:hypothetical protein PHYSODRAFT_341532 [Phytophthora sojae]EGZ06249.1 hypothetical protein PHYSODRAFT_341532 [Phytophthora sojae]|eukprot:XP_009538146.1 hypothetical protein PHYSODRAFT_341532 [Phytophthora sojae]